MSGIRNLCRMYGGMTIQGVKYVWDYANEEAVKADEMPLGSDRWNASEKAKAGISHWSKAGYGKGKAW